MIEPNTTVISGTYLVEFRTTLEVTASSREKAIEEATKEFRDQLNSDLEFTSEIL